MWLTMALACKFPEAVADEPVATGPENVEGDAAGECSDGADDDQDGYFDCDDNNCWGSPSCEGSTVVPPTEPPPVTTPPVTTPPVTTPPTTPEGGPLCAFTSIELTYALYTYATPGWEGFWPACLLILNGPGTFDSCTDTTVTFDGDWVVDEALSVCPPEQVPLVPTWSGGSYHTFQFTDDLDVLTDWFAHRDVDDASVDGDPVWYMTEIDYAVDMAVPEPFVDYRLEEEISQTFFDVYLTHALQVTFHR